jgi:beta-glucanase (GH16 family)
MTKKNILPVVALLIFGGLISACKKDNLKVSKPANADESLLQQQRVNSTANGPDLSNFTFFGQEDFNGTSLDSNVWGYYREGDTVDGSVFRRECAQVANGNLYCITKKVSNNPALFNSVSVTTNLRPKYYFRYGYFEFRARLPRAVGNVGALWMQQHSVGAAFNVPKPAVYGAEIDILEYSFTQPQKAFYSLHWNGYNFRNTNADSPRVRTFTDNLASLAAPGIYHTFGLVWTPEEYIIYVDNQERVRGTEAVSQIPEFLILGSGTGGFGGSNYVGPWPDTFAIDYVKVYKLNPTVPDAVRLFGSCDGEGWVSQGLQPGDYTAADLLAKGFTDNDVSSMDVPAGWTVTVYDGPNFDGVSLDIITSVQCFNTFINGTDNKLSSIKVRKLI